MSLYREIYAEIKQGILTNHYRAGSQLPPQEELADQFKVSRITLKKALNLLQNEGLIYTQQGAGTFIRPQVDFGKSELLPIDYPVGVTYSHRDSRISSKILYFDARLPLQKEQKNLNISPDSPVYEFKRVRMINDKIYSFEHTIMPVYIAAINKKILKNSVYDYLGKVAKLQLTDARRIIYAERSDKEIAEALGIEKNDPVLVIEQTAYDQKGRAFEFSNSYFKSSQSKFVLDLHVNNVMENKGYD